VWAAARGPAGGGRTELGKPAIAALAPEGGWRGGIGGGRSDG
jgi:hypothetical protein